MLPDQDAWTRGRIPGRHVRPYEWWHSEREFAVFCYLFVVAGDQVVSVAKSWGAHC